MKAALLRQIRSNAKAHEREMQYSGNHSRPQLVYCCISHPHVMDLHKSPLGVLYICPHSEMWRTKPRLGPIGADHAQQRNSNIWSMGSEVVYSKGNTPVF